jgi:lipooligosaccharide transport system ATP-binding protein
MDEAAALCDRILIMDNGKIIENGVPYALIRRYVGEDVLEVDYDEAVLKTVKQQLPEAEIEVYGDQMRVYS